jgi:flagellar basal-body rod modification protein FlgD
MANPTDTIKPVTPASPLDVGGITDPSTLAKRRISAEVNGDQLTSSTVNEGNSKIFDSASKKLGKQDFLKLLVTQLRFQDPLSPTENTEFVAQLAQFSNLEGTQNINTSIEDLTKKLETMVSGQATSATSISNASATSLIGKRVRVTASDIIFDPSSKKGIDINVHADAGNTSVLSILDEKGVIVNALPISKPGELLIQWNGQKIDGSMAPAGKYQLKITTRDGTADTGYTYLEDRVTGINYSKTGLRLEVRGQSINMDQVVHVGEDLPAVVPKEKP